MTAEVLVIGAGPAGLAAAVQTAGAGLKTVVADANLSPGGQLIKQIHKFFGSARHRAGTRGIDIARQLTTELEAAGGLLWLDSPVYGLFEDRSAAIARGLLQSVASRVPGSGAERAAKQMLRPEAVILACGAQESVLTFPGWTLPGVIGAGAAQTMINVHRVRPGNRVLMVGAGNVGLIVSYQLRQAGARVVAIVEGLDRIGGYHVHAAKVARLGIPILTGHTIVRANGSDGVRSAVIAPVDDRFQPILDRARELDVDTVCIATGLKPFSRLAWMAGCKAAHSRVLGGWMPWHGEDMETTVSGIYVAGDVAGIEEASTALDEGRLAGISAAVQLGAISEHEGVVLKQEIRASLNALRSGPFGDERRQAKQELSESGAGLTLIGPHGREEEDGACQTATI